MQKYYNTIFFAPLLWNEVAVCKSCSIQGPMLNALASYDQIQALAGQGI